MADRAAWVSWAFSRYHAGQITFEQLAALVREHRATTEQPTGDPGA